MQLDSFIKIIEVFTPLIKSVIWPILILSIFLSLRGQFGVFFENISELKLKAGGIEATAISQREQIMAAALLGAASIKDANTGVDTSEIANAVTELAKTSNKSTSPHVLWVDDIPSNNHYEKEALERMGVEFSFARSTEDAISKVEKSDYDLIISDMGRPPDTRAGYTLLDELRNRGNNIPFVIYAGSRSPEHQKESISHGAIGTTNRPDELFILVSRGLLTVTRQQ